MSGGIVKSGRKVIYKAKNFVLKESSKVVD